MLVGNLRHLRVFLGVAQTGSVTRAAAAGFVSQPAVTQAIAKLEVAAGTALFRRTQQGLFPTEAGALFQNRVARALARLDMAMSDLAPRLTVTATRAQLSALIATVEAQNFTLAAHRLGIAQPTVHRAITGLEAATGRALFRRSPVGVAPTRQAAALALAARLAFAELDQAVAELAELQGREAGCIVIGALPLSRSALLPQALVRFRRERPTLPVIVNDGPYRDLLAGLRRGEIDLMIGALRVPTPAEDVVQERLFDDGLMVLAGPDHPLSRRRDIDPTEIAGHQWVVPRAGSPARAQFDAFFTAATGRANPAGMIEAGSILLMRELLSSGDFLGCISGLQAEAEIAKGLLAPLDLTWDWPARPIGLTVRRDWRPTAAQAILLRALRDVAARVRELPRSGQAR